MCLPIISEGHQPDLQTRMESKMLGSRKKMQLKPASFESRATIAAADEIRKELPFRAGSRLSGFQGSVFRGFVCERARDARAQGQAQAMKSLGLRSHVGISTV